MLHRELRVPRGQMTPSAFQRASSSRVCPSHGPKDQDVTMREIMSPSYDRVRGGLVNLAENAEGQEFPVPGLFLRKALPDRVDVIENIVAEGDRVAMLW